MTERYIIGTYPVPKWCRAFLMPYKKNDGSVGYEFHGKFRDYDLETGDVLIYDGFLVKVEFRKKGRDVK